MDDPPGFVAKDLTPSRNMRKSSLDSQCCCNRCCDKYTYKKGLEDHKAKAHPQEKSPDQNQNDLKINESLLDEEDEEAVKTVSPSSFIMTMR